MQARIQGGVLRVKPPQTGSKKFFHACFRHKPFDESVKLGAQNELKLIFEHVQLSKNFLGIILHRIWGGQNARSAPADGGWTSFAEHRRLLNSQHLLLRITTQQMEYCDQSRLTLCLHNARLFIQLCNVLPYQMAYLCRVKALMSSHS
jgi:hypothetical protein